MKVSVIIPTYNGAQKILNILHSLEKQTFTDFETVVLIDGSTDNTLQLLNNTTFLLNSLKVIKRENGGRSKARNSGALASSGDLLIFFDDDMLPLPDCIELHTKHHENYPGSMLAGVARMDVAKDPENDFFKYRFHIESQWQLPYIGKLTKIEFANYAFTSQNMSVSKEVFESLSMFDERLTDSEDFDLSIRAIATGIPVYYDYRIWASHADYITLEQYIKRQIEYMKARTKLAQLRPELVKLIPGAFVWKRPSITKRLFMKLFKYNILWSWLLHSKFFLHLFPAKIRFWLYSIIIYSGSYKY